MGTLLFLLSMLGFSADAAIRFVKGLRNPRGRLLYSRYLTIGTKRIGSPHLTVWAAYLIVIYRLAEHFIPTVPIGVRAKIELLAGIVCLITISLYYGSLLLREALNPPEYTPPAPDTQHQVSPPGRQH